MKNAFLLAAAFLALAAEPATAETVHVVKPGETLNGIANRAGVAASAVAAANDLEPPYAIRIGQKLKLPQTSSTRPAKEPASPAPATSKPEDKAKAVAKVADAAAPAARQVASAARVIEQRAPSSPGAAEYETEHLVAPGETLGGIAARAKVPRVLIAEANALQPPYNVRVGQKLKIPRTGRHRVKAGETGFSIALDTAVPWEQIALANNLDPKAAVKPGQMLLIPTLLAPPPAQVAAPQAQKPVAAALPRDVPQGVSAPRFAWPLTGSIRRPYATGAKYHDGLDIAAPKGTMVRSAAPGTVVFAGKESDQFGNLVVVDHGDGWHTAYGFLSRVTVKEGARVAAGERVGLVGDTGLAKGSELHFEVRQNGKPVDPQAQLPKAP